MCRTDQLMFTSMVVMLCLIAVAASSSLANEAGRSPVEFVQGSERVTVAIDGLPVAVYYFHDDKIPRPFFAHVRALNGVQVTRHHPPIDGQDPVDHATIHPGIWLAFGDVNGSDYWRDMSPIRFAAFVEPPKGGAGRGSFAVHNKYLDQKDNSKTVCDEIARYTFVRCSDGYLLLWDSTFSSDRGCAFGDQEEMGLGFRVATPIRVERKSAGGVPPGNGRILDAKGRMNGDQIWGNSADWCDYSGTMAGSRVGMTIFCHPDNFRPSWFHARDYGLLVANPFGRQAFGKGEKSSVVAKPGEKLRLRYGVLVHSGAENSDLDRAAAYKEYLRLSGM